MAAKKPSFVSKIAEKTTGEKVAILLLVMVVLGFLYWQALYSPLSDELNQIEGQYGALEQQNQQLKQRQKEYDALVLRADEIRKELKGMSTELPKQADLSSFMGYLQRQAATAGVTTRVLRASDEEPQGSFTRVPVQVEVSGTYMELMKYFHLLYETRRITTVEDFSISRDDEAEEEVSLNASFTATTFYQPAPEAAGQPAAAQPGQPAQNVPGGKTGQAIVDKAAETRDQRQADLEAAAGAGGEDMPEQPAGQGEAPDKPDKAGIDRLKNPGGN